MVCNSKEGEESMGGRIMMISWVELKTYHVVRRGNNEAGVEKDSCEIGRSE